MNRHRYRDRDNSDNALSMNQFGFTLVELMVAMVVGLFLVGGVASMYFSTLQSYFVLKDNAQIAQRQRVAATFVGAVVQSGGYYNQANRTRVSAFPKTNSSPLPASPFMSYANSGQFLVGLDDDYTDAQGNLRQKDTLQLRMRMQAGEDVLNCWGKGGDATERIYVNALVLDSDGQQLECVLWKEDPAGSGKIVKASNQHHQPLLDGVVSLEFTYGVDTDGDGSADQYLEADDVETKQKWRDVRSIVMVIGFATHNAATGNVNTTDKPVEFRAVFPVRPGMQ